MVFRDTNAAAQAMRSLQGFEFFGKEMVRWTWIMAFAWQGKADERHRTSNTRKQSQTRYRSWTARTRSRPQQRRRQRQEQLRASGQNYSNLYSQHLQAQQQRKRLARQQSHRRSQMLLRQVPSDHVRRRTMMLWMRTTKAQTWRWTRVINMVWTVSRYGVLWHETVSRLRAYVMDIGYRSRPVMLSSAASSTSSVLLKRLSVLTGSGKQ